MCHQLTYIAWTLLGSAIIYESWSCGKFSLCSEKHNFMPSSESPKAIKIFLVVISLRDFLLHFERWQTLCRPLSIDVSTLEHIFGNLSTAKSVNSQVNDCTYSNAFFIFSDLSRSRFGEGHHGLTRVLHSPQRGLQVVGRASKVEGRS